MMSGIRSMLEQLDLTRGSFLRNLAVFTGGSFLAYLIGFIFTPIITRIYTPEDYGLFSFFNASVALLSSCAFLGYNEALILPDSTRKFFRLSGLIMLCAFAMALFLVAFMVPFGDVFTRFFSVENLQEWLWVFPVMIVLQALYRISDNYLIREKYFQRNAHARIAGVLSSKSIVTILGLTRGSTIWGLILGEAAARIIGILVMLRAKLIILLSGIYHNFSPTNLREIAQEFRQYPLRIFPSSLLMQLALYLPIFVIGKAYDSEFLGYFSLAFGLLQIPIQVIGFSMGKVFLQKMNELWSDSGGNISQQVLKFYIGVLVLATATYAFIFGFGEVIFKYFAGEDWLLSGTIAEYLAFPLAIQLTVVAVNPIFRVMRQERMQFNTNLFSTLVFLAFVFSPWIFDIENIEFIQVLAIGLFVRHLIILLFVLKSAQVNVWKVLSISLIAVALVFYLFGFFANYVVSFFQLL